MDWIIEHGVRGKLLQSKWGGGRGEGGGFYSFFYNTFYFLFFHFIFKDY